MATSSFDRRLEVTDVESAKRLISIMGKDAPTPSLSNHPYTQQERERSAVLLKECLSRSRK